MRLVRYHVCSRDRPRRPKGCLSDSIRSVSGAGSGYVWSAARETDPPVSKKSIASSQRLAPTPIDYGTSPTKMENRHQILQIRLPDVHTILSTYVILFSLSHKEPRRTRNMASLLG